MSESNTSSISASGHSKNKIDQELKEALSKAIWLQYHRKTYDSPMVDQLSGIYSELVQYRKTNNIQLRKADEVRKHLDAIILDLWIAAKYYESPWRIISLDSNDFSPNRYKGKFPTYRLFNGVINNLYGMDYIDKSKYYHDKKSQGRSKKTRIKATKQLLEKLNFDISKIERNTDIPDEIIIKRGEDKKNIDYKDDDVTIQMRENLIRYNELLRNTNIETTDINLCNKCDITSRIVRRIFNQDDNGGRFYHGFWMSLPKKDRLKLKLNGEEVCELDYVAQHATITYALKGIELNDDPYKIEGHARSDIKKTFRYIFNCESRRVTINTMRKYGIKNAESLLQKIEEHHQPISEKFYDPWFGMYLQRDDSLIAEFIINKLTKKGIACLPIHDSFIIAKKYESELMFLMKDYFYKIYHVNPMIKCYY